MSPRINDVATRPLFDVLNDPQTSKEEILKLMEEWRTMFPHDDDVVTLKEMARAGKRFGVCVVDGSIDKQSLKIPAKYYEVVQDLKSIHGIDALDIIREVLSEDE